MLKTLAPTHPLGRWRCWAQVQVLPWTRPSPACRQGYINENEIETPACRRWRPAPQKLGTAQSSNPGPAIWEEQNKDGEITVMRGMEFWSSCDFQGNISNIWKISWYMARVKTKFLSKKRIRKFFCLWPRRIDIAILGVWTPSYYPNHKDGLYKCVHTCFMYYYHRQVI